MTGGDVTDDHVTDGNVTDDNGRGVWIRAALAQLARGGIDSVRVEVVAQNLGVTKGGFYRRFRDRQDLLQGLLSAWSEGRIAAIAQQTRLDGATARDRLRALIKLYSERINTDAMRIELAIRQWAQSDAAAAAAVARVDKARLGNVEQLYRALGLSAAAARAQAFLFYSFVFGQSLLVIEQSNRKRRDLLAMSAALLTEIEAPGARAS